MVSDENSAFNHILVLIHDEPFCLASFRNFFLSFISLIAMYLNVDLCVFISINHLVSCMCKLLFFFKFWKFSVTVFKKSIFLPLIHSFLLRA